MIFDWLGFIFNFLSFEFIYFIFCCCFCFLNIANYFVFFLFIWGFAADETKNFRLFVAWRVCCARSVSRFHVAISTESKKRWRAASVIIVEVANPNMNASNWRAHVVVCVVYVHHHGRPVGLGVIFSDKGSSHIDRHWQWLPASRARRKAMCSVLLGLL